VRDSIPKAIGFFLVRKSQDSLQFELYNQVNSNKSLSSTLGEPARITERRKALTDVLNTLKNSLKVLQRDPDIASNTVGDEELENALRLQAMEDRRNHSMAGGQRGGGGQPNRGGMPPNRGGMPPNRGGMPPPNRGGMPPGNMPPGNMPPGRAGMGGGNAPPGNMPPGNMPPGGQGKATGNLFGNQNPLGR